MKILVLTPEFPYPLNQGGRIRMFNLIKGLASRGHQIHLVSSLLDAVLPQYVDVFTAFCDSIYFIPHPQLVHRKIGWVFCSLLLRKPFVVFKHTPSSMKRIVRDIASRLKPDVILVEFHYISDCVEELLLPSIVDMHNVDYVLYERFAKNPRWGLKKLHGMLQRPIMYNFERMIPYRFRVCVTVSEIDASLLKQISGAENIWVVPNGVDVEYFKADYEEINRWDLIYVGSMDYHPNIDAVLFLYQEVMPKIWSYRPETTLAIVGRNPAPAVKSLSKDPRITVTGEVKDVRDYWNRSLIAVLPLRMGGGTRLKALEAASMRKAIVGTSIGLEGIPFENGRHVIIADHPDDLASAILNLLGNHERRKALGEAARSFVVQHYSWSKCVEMLETVLNRVVSQSKESLRRML